MVENNNNMLTREEKALKLYRVETIACMINKCAENNSFNVALGNELKAKKFVTDLIDEVYKLLIKVDKKEL